MAYWRLPGRLQKYVCRLNTGGGGSRYTSAEMHRPSVRSPRHQHPSARSRAPQPHQSPPETSVGQACICQAQLGVRQKMTTTRQSNLLTARGFVAIVGATKSTWRCASLHEQNGNVASQHHSTMVVSLAWPQGPQPAVLDPTCLYGRLTPNRTRDTNMMFFPVFPTSASHATCFSSRYKVDNVTKIYPRQHLK